MAEITEGKMPFKGYETWFRIVGEKSGDKKPLILLHGGPGSAHDYFEVLDRLSDEDGRQLIMYDQLGCGNSYAEGEKDLWVFETWLEELICLRKFLGLDEVHILGQSWGGMLLLEYVCRKNPEGVKSLILSSTLPSSQMWGMEQRRMIKELPEDMQMAIDEADRTNDYENSEYIRAENEFMSRHCCGTVTDDMPECLRRKVRKGTESYITAWGPNEFTPTGTLRDYDVTDLLKYIRQPSLIISGGNDLCTPYIAKYMADRIPVSEWELFRSARHMCFAEETDGYIDVLRNWLDRND